MMKKEELKEIKKGEFGTGLLIENDGYISINSTENNRMIKEAFDNSSDWYVPKPFIVDAVFQKYDVKNANGRVYPERVLKKQVQIYQQKIDERRAYGECYRPEALILTENGWVQLKNVKEGDNIITLNTETNEIEVKPILTKIEKDFDGNLINIKNRNIDDIVTPLHEFIIHNQNGKFLQRYTADQISNDAVKNSKQKYIPRNGKWIGKNDSSIYGIDIIRFAKMLGLYLSCGKLQEDKVVLNLGDKIEKVSSMLSESGINYELNPNNDVILNDSQFIQAIHGFNLFSNKRVPVELKQQNASTLQVFYDWYCLCGSISKGDKFNKQTMTEDVLTNSEQVALDLNEIQLKLGYCGLIKKEGNKYHSLKLTSKLGISLDKRFLKKEKIKYAGKVMCVEVENHTWYVMDNNKCHWTSNCNHPAESTIDLGRISHNIVELHWEGRTLVGKMELNISEGFRKQGICSSLGDTVALLLLNGYKIGVSSRGVGSVEQKLGQTIVGDDFELICWDVVSDPSTNNAYISTKGKESMSQWIENKDPKKKALNEKLNKIDKLLLN